jgi:competence protein ComGC
MEARSYPEKDMPPLSAQLPMPDAVRRSLGSERGFSLVELLVVIPMMVIILMGIYALYDAGAHSQRLNNDRVTTMLRQQNGLERLTREMRQAISFKPVSSQILDAETYVRPSGGGTSVEKHVRYECLSGSCIRYEGAANGSTFSSSQTVITGIQNADVFFFQPDSVNPTYTSVRLEVSVKGASNPITLEGGFALRNQNGA